MQSLLFVDLEASGLHPDSYPVELGWSGSSEGSCLIRPEPGWTHWDPEAEAVHGLSRDALFKDGIDVKAAANLLKMAADGAIIVSDAPEFDEAWLHELFSAAGEPKPWPRIHAWTYQAWVATEDLFDLVLTGREIQRLRYRCIEAGSDVLQEARAVRHRALPDAQRLRDGYQTVLLAVTAALEQHS